MKFFVWRFILPSAFILLIGMYMYEICTRWACSSKKVPNNMGPYTKMTSEIHQESSEYLCNSHFLVYLQPRSEVVVHHNFSCLELWEKIADLKHLSHSHIVLNIKHLWQWPAFGELWLPGAAKGSVSNKKTQLLQKLFLRFAEFCFSLDKFEF